MPVSEDELESRIHSSMPHGSEYRYSALSKAEQRRVSYTFIHCTDYVVKL